MSRTAVEQARPNAQISFAVPNALIAEPSVLSVPRTQQGQRNEGAPWDFFVSHKQNESGRDAALITRDLEQAGKTVWLDVNMKDLSTDAMLEGVEHSKTFVLVLSHGYFDSKFCVMELSRAVDLRKNIVLCHKEGVNVGAILQTMPPEFRTISDHASLQLVTSDATSREVAVKRLISLSST